MNLRQLEIFHAIMLGSTVHAAARALGISQPAASKILRQAERELGITLFVRERGRLRPTAEAEKLHPEIDRLLGEVVGVREHARELRDGLSGALTIAATPTVAEAILPHALARFRARRPQIRIWVQVTAKRQVFALAHSGRVDLALLTWPFESAMLIAEKLLDVELVCLLPRRHALAGRKTLSLDDLAEFPLISNLHSSSIADLQRTESLEPLERQIMISVNHTATAASLVRSGAGLALTDPLITEAPDLVRRPFRPRIELSPYLVYRKDRMLSRLAQSLVDLIKKEAVRNVQRRGVGIRLP